jgi:hypothetical protein
VRRAAGDAAPERRELLAELGERRIDLLLVRLYRVGLAACLNTQGATDDPDDEQPAHHLSPSGACAP